MEIGNVAIIPFTLAVTQALKTLFGVEGKTNQLVAVIVATVLTSLSLLIDNGVFNETTTLDIQIVTQSLVGGLSAIGLFDYVRQEFVEPRITAKQTTDSCC